MLRKETEMAGCVLCKGSDVVGLVLGQKDEIRQHNMLQKKLNYKQYTTGRYHLKNTRFITNLHKYALFMQNVIHHHWLP